MNIFNKEFYSFEGKKIAYYTTGLPQKSVILFCHGNSFHSLCWRMMMQHFSEYYCLAFDYPGHGHSDYSVHAHNDSVDLDRVKEDGVDFCIRGLTALLQSLGVQEVICVGHSFGFCLSTWLATQQSIVKVIRIIGVEPSIYPESIQSRFDEMSEIILNYDRRDFFESVDQFYSMLSRKRIYKSWNTTILKDFCEGALTSIPNELGYHELLCKVELEKQFYRWFFLIGHQLFCSIFSDINCPVLIIRGSDSFPDEDIRSLVNFSYAISDGSIVDYFGEGSDLVIEGANHFLPMQYPLEVADAIRSYIVNV